MASTGKTKKRKAARVGKRRRDSITSDLVVDYKTIRTIDHECGGCSEIGKTCCARYDVCVTGAEIKKIIPFLPEAAKFCPHLKEKKGYANVFEEMENGLHTIDTRENGLCVFAFRNEGLIRCSLHKVEMSHGLRLGSVKPKMCVLWPLTFSPDGRVLTLHDNALFCEGSSLRKKPSRRISPAFLETIELMTGESPLIAGLPSHRNQKRGNGRL
jgi:hypothetical protein